MNVNKLIKEIEIGIKQSLDEVRKKAVMVVERADELTEEGKKQYRLYELNSRRQRQSALVGEKLYELVEGNKMMVTDNALKIPLESLAKTIAEIDGLKRKKQKAPVKVAPIESPARTIAEVDSLKGKKQKASVKVAPKKTSLKPEAGPKKKSAVKKVTKP